MKNETIETIESKLTQARNDCDKFEQKIWETGRDLEDMTDKEGELFDRLATEERALYERLCTMRGLPVGTPL
jgi:hypothetical protein